MTYGNKTNISCRKIKQNIFQKQASKQYIEYGNYTYGIQKYGMRNMEIIWK